MTALVRSTAKVVIGIVMWLLYFTVLVPVALLRPRLRARWRRSGARPVWLRRVSATTNLSSARKQS